MASEEIYVEVALVDVEIIGADGSVNHKRLPIEQIPEPSTLWVLVSAGGLLWWRRR